MSKRPSPEQIAEYDECQLFINTLYRYLIVNSGDPEWEETIALPLPDPWRNGHPFSQSFEGVKQAASDLLADTRDATGDELAKIDGFLSQSNSPTLSEMRRRIWQSLPKVLKRGRIRNETEYYLLKEIAEGTSQSDLEPAEYELVCGLIGDYEARQ